MWWTVAALLVGAAVGLAVAAFRRETASATALDARAGGYPTGGFVFAALAFIIVLSKLA
jgi:hypothetical protein